MSLYVGSEMVAAPYGAAQRSAAGRVAARRALAGCDGPEMLLGRTELGAPIFPAGFSGSISHTETIAISVVCREKRLIGIDIENRPPAPEVDRFLLQTDAEREIASDPQVGRIGVWVAKEAAFKALHRQRDLHGGIFLRLRLTRESDNELGVQNDTNGLRIFVASAVTSAAALAISDTVSDC